ncbi:hypothetical protein HDU82_004972 [Entophlyctis luteolus]|nr:hypothetical protein HDU82_004972 [Entophlyctis luteolus]
MSARIATKDGAAFSFCTSAGSDSCSGSATAIGWAGISGCRKRRIECLFEELTIGPQIEEPSPSATSGSATAETSTLRAAMRALSISYPAESSAKRFTRHSQLTSDCPPGTDSWPITESDPSDPSKREKTADKLKQPVTFVFARSARAQSGGNPRIMRARRDRPGNRREGLQGAGTAKRAFVFLSSDSSHAFNSGSLFDDILKGFGTETFCRFGTCSVSATSNSALAKSVDSLSLSSSLSSSSSASWIVAPSTSATTCSTPLTLKSNVDFDNREELVFAGSDCGWIDGVSANGDDDEYYGDEEDDGDLTDALWILGNKSGISRRKRVLQHKIRSHGQQSRDGVGLQQFFAQ